jgi:hypothetical protein
VVYIQVFVLSLIPSTKQQKQATLEEQEIKHITTWMNPENAVLSGRSHALYSSIYIKCLETCKSTDRYWLPEDEGSSRTN